MPHSTDPGHLPPIFFEQLGRYVAYCGHIEREAWILVGTLREDLNPDDPDFLKKLMAIRKLSTSDLIKEIKACEAKLGGELKERLSSLRVHIEATSQNRHMAIHGAWYCHGSGYHVEYFQKHGKGQTAAYFWDSSIVMTDADLARYVADCERVFFELRAIRMQVDSQIERPL